MIESIPIKEAKTQFPVLDVIRKRWSARAFSEQSVTEEQLLTMIEAASWAPSSMNEQPWKYIVARKEDQQGFSKLLSVMNGSNAIWANKGAVLLLCVATTTYGKEQDNNPSALHDAGMANMSLLLQATALDIYTHVIGGFNHDKAIQEFQLQPNQKPVCMIVLGYLDSPDVLNEPFKTREVTPRSRKDLDTFYSFSS